MSIRLVHCHYLNGSLPWMNGDHLSDKFMDITCNVCAGPCGITLQNIFTLFNLKSKISTSICLNNHRIAEYPNNYVPNINYLKYTDD